MWAVIEFKLFRNAFRNFTYFLADLWSVLWRFWN